MHWWPEKERSRPVVATKTLYNQGSHIYHNLSSVSPPFLLARNDSSLEQSGVWFLFSRPAEGREWGVGSVLLGFRVFGALGFSIQRLASEKGISTHKLFMPPFVPGFVPGTNWVCPCDKLGFHCVKIGENLGLSQGHPRFVPKTNLVCPWNKPGAAPMPTPHSRPSEVSCPDLPKMLSDDFL